MLETQQLDISPVGERQYLPPSSELADSDDIPVDNEDQNLLPNILLFLLQNIWFDRQDWYFGADMGIYHTTGVNPRVPVVPDGFLSMGVERRKNGKSRRSYVTWEEDDIAPNFMLEMVSWSPGGEYDDKLEIYRKLGILYYVIYNSEFWKRDDHQPLEIYKLIEGQYQLQLGEPFWMPEIGLGFGRFRSPQLGGLDEGLGWFNKQGTRYLLAEERVTQSEQRLALLADKLQELGIDPNAL
jgi:Uma2 family endonuclease